jgi:hypothetical protein
MVRNIRDNHMVNQPHRKPDIIIMNKRKILPRSKLTVEQDMEDSPHFRLMISNSRAGRGIRHTKKL